VAAPPLTARVLPPSRPRRAQATSKITSRRRGSSSASGLFFATPSIAVDPASARRRVLACRVGGWSARTRAPSPSFLQRGHLLRRHVAARTPRVRTLIEGAGTSVSHTSTPPNLRLKALMVLPRLVGHVFFRAAKFSPQSSVTLLTPTSPAPRFLPGADLECSRYGAHGTLRGSHERRRREIYVRLPSWAQNTVSTSAARRPPFFPRYSAKRRTKLWPPGAGSDGDQIPEVAASGLSRVAISPLTGGNSPVETQVILRGPCRRRYPPDDRKRRCRCPRRDVVTGAPLAFKSGRRNSPSSVGAQTT